MGVLVTSSQLHVAHAPVRFADGAVEVLSRARREDAMRQTDSDTARLAQHATPAIGAGNRARTEDPDPLRTCFERDLDRIKHSKSFRRLAGKCQVFIAPDDDHLRTRLTHAIEVAQVAVAIARPLRLNVALTEAAALGHDCGHGPAGHASEDALSPFLSGGYHHATYGADVVLAPYNLCEETLDAIRNHSWNRPAPSTPEGEVVAWADRIAYVCHDFEDAVSAGIVSPDDLPIMVAETAGSRRSEQLASFITALVESSAATGTIGMRETEAEALGAFRAFNFEHIYLRPEARTQAARVIDLLGQLTEWHIEHPEAIGDFDPSRPEPVVEQAVRWVSGMTDRFALHLAVEHLGWPMADLPRGA